MPKEECVHTDQGPLTTAMAQEALAPLIGQPLTDMRRPLWQIFEFGEQRPTRNRHGEDITLADWLLSIYCSWQLTRGDSVILGYDDFSHNLMRATRRFFDRKTPPKDAIARKRWKAANELFALVESGVLIVRCITVHPAGGVAIGLSDDYEIRTFNDMSDPCFLWSIYRKPTSSTFGVDGSPIGLEAWTYAPVALA